MRRLRAERGAPGKHEGSRLAVESVEVDVGDEPAEERPRPRAKRTRRR
jgi:hypothetical protein